MQHFGIGKDKIPFISERNPTKVGLRCVGTDIELISEEKARSLKPKAMVVLPWYFKDEIVEREKQYINMWWIIDDDPAHGGWDDIVDDTASRET